MHGRISKLAHSIPAVVAFALLGAPPDALACGGTFCDRPPAGQPAMPVDQSGENILFVMANGHVEAHIQIQYTGDPARFAWLVPVPAVPKVAVGSQQLFVNLLNATVPTFAVTSSFEVCGTGGDRVSTSGCAFGGASDSSNSVAAFGGDGGARNRTDEQPTDVAVGHQAVGAFDVTILQSKSAADVLAWLDANGFLYDGDALPILEDYVSRGHVFVALKLQPGAGVNEIHPLVIDYPGTEPCIPLMLTRVAATEDMAVRAFFLGDRRVSPLSYREVTPNPLRFDWANLGANYVSVISRAVDEPGADGHAFVTEYAGPSSAVQATGLSDPRWNSDRFRGLAPEAVIGELGREGLVSCPTSLGCVALHPLVLPIVHQYLPAPAGMDESQFYSCLSCFKDRIDQAAWDGDAFAAALEERVIAPGKHAAELLATSRYATRLFTTISPFEMTEDPTFVEAPLSAPPVRAARTATIDQACNGDVALKVPGRPDAVMVNGASPAFSSDMPYALTVEAHDPLPIAGDPSVVEDSSGAIDDQVQTWNRASGFPRPAAPGRTRDTLSCGCVLGGGPANPGHAVALALGLGALRRVFRRRERAAR